MIAEIERATGGPTEIGEFRFDWKNLTAEVAPFVLRGTEPATERPLFRADSVKVGLKIISMMKRDIDISSLWWMRLRSTSWWMPKERPTSRSPK